MYITEIFFQLDMYSIFNDTRVKH